MDNDSFREIYALVQDWARRTDKAEKAEFKRLGIGITNSLYPTIGTKVSQAGAGRIIAEHSFQDVGRLVDMGAGPGAPGYNGNKKATVERAIDTLENKDRNREKARGERVKPGRVPKKFYSVIFYSRLNALMGVVSGSMQEQALAITRQIVQEQKGKT